LAREWHPISQPAWLMKVAQNRAIDILRQRQQHGQKLIDVLDDEERS